MEFGGKVRKWLIVFLGFWFLDIVMCFLFDVGLDDEIVDQWCEYVVKEDCEYYVFWEGRVDDMDYDNYEVD